MITLEQSTQNIITTKGLFAIPVEAFQFNWDILNRIFISTFRKYERYCPLTKTIQIGGGNPTILPEDCIYPQAIGFGNQSMIMPQTATITSRDWSYDSSTRKLSIFTNTGSSAAFKVQYLARYPMTKVETCVEPVEVYAGETTIEIQLDYVPDLSTISITKEDLSLEVSSRDRFSVHFEGTLGTAVLDLSSLVLTVTQSSNAVTSGFINIYYVGKYPAFNFVGEDTDFFETWYAANILSSLGNIKAVVNLSEMPNSVSADDLIAQGRDLMNQVLDWQKAEKTYWWKGYMGGKL